MVTSLNWISGAVKLSVANLNRNEQNVINVTSGHDHDGSNSRLAKAGYAYFKQNFNEDLYGSTGTNYRLIESIYINMAENTRTLIYANANIGIQGTNNTYLFIKLGSDELHRVFIGSTGQKNGGIAFVYDIPKSNNSNLELWLYPNVGHPSLYQHVYGHQLGYSIIGKV